MQQSLLKVILCGFFFQSLLKAGALLLIDMPLNLFLRKVTHPADNSIRKKEAQRTLLHIVLLVTHDITLYSPFFIKLYCILRQYSLTTATLKSECGDLASPHSL